ncbi:dihydroxy-acid dehydratase [Boseongicola sp. H5]|uniref:dihydroxy-acid dehydratase n=1 Tax=Boseongicola sp. H5 TaxID=2763261 RepID=UPI001D09A3D3|nr:dihydroxy-acid dehydratase [Boseongicola sp. H5]
MTRDPKTYRSAKWFADPGKLGHTSRERIHQIGASREDFMGKPVIGILSTWSEMNPCHIHFRERAEDVKRGVWQAGGFPVEIPVLSLGEPFMKPTTMIYRDLMSAEVEEVLVCHPLDGAVLMGGCDKTPAAMLMGALSASIPSVFLPSGPMLSGEWRGTRLGSGTDLNKAHDALKRGEIGAQALVDMETGGARSAGHCMTMGTASTMCSIAEAMGMCPAGSSSIPAPDSRHRAMAAQVGRIAVDLVRRDVRPEMILGADAFHNAIVTLMALGGSTNAVIHLMAMADRAGVPLELEDFGRLSETVPVLADIRPSGEYLMEDFHRAGGVPALLDRIRDHLRLAAPTVTGRSLGEEIAAAECFDDRVIRPRDEPVIDNGGLVVLRGNLAPGGAVLKRSAATPALLKNRGKAICFNSRADVNARIDDPSFELDETTVLVLKYAGPKGVGLPEWGMLPLPKRLAERGVKDLVRLSDARMSGTHYGTVVLHITPEAADGGPLALVEDGDWITLDADAGTLTLEVSDEELARRRAAWTPPHFEDKRGWAAFYRREARSASDGAGVEFLAGSDRRKDPLM